jgi:ADP-ribosylglycohydrolase
MIGAIIGDMVGAPYEGRRHVKDPKTFPLITEYSNFTDDTVCTFAIADAILNGYSYDESLRHWCRKHPHAGYARRFKAWFMHDNSQPYESIGNGSAMRVSPVGWLFDSLDEVLEEAKKSASCTHNSREGIKGAQAVAAAIYMLRTGQRTKQTLRAFITERFGYNLDFTIAQIKGTYKRSILCKDTVPQAIVCYLDSFEFEGAIRRAVSLNGDSDTLACIAGSIAEADPTFHISIEHELRQKAKDKLKVEGRFQNRHANKDYEKMMRVLNQFNDRVDYGETY